MLVFLALGTLALAQPKPEFRLGFKALADQIPNIVGEPLEIEHYSPNGDSIQRTTAGMMVWRRADNWTAFTNGSCTWINGPAGVQDRGNDERFPWEETAGVQPMQSVRRVGGSGQYPSLRAAIDAAADGDVIQVAQGTYGENITINRPRNVRILGGWSADFATRSVDGSQTIIDGRGSGSVFDLGAANGVVLSLAMEGLTIRNGMAPQGGGIRALASGAGSRINLTLSNVSVANNNSGNRGGGLYLYATKEGSMVATIAESTIADNRAKNEGGGLRVETQQAGTAEVTIARSVISRNAVTASAEGDGGIDGGGVAAYAAMSGKTNLTITNSKVSDNSAAFGGGLFGYSWGAEALLNMVVSNNIVSGNRARWGAAVFSCSGVTDPNTAGHPGGSTLWRLTNNTITGNVASEGDTIQLHSGSTFGDGGPIDMTLRNDILWGNERGKGRDLTAVVDPGRTGAVTAQAAYSDIGSVGTLTGASYRSDHVIQVDPLFVDPARGDFRLRDGSPGIDAGDPDAAHNDGRRPPGKGAPRSDIGAYGGPKNGDWP